ncbi:dihydrodipicolinate synthase family protein, partial [bacterium]|nr:dihydrodipicolinate synthase family protein [bacterium]
IMYLCGDKITLLSGDDKIILPVMSIGGKGVISVVANIIPDKVSSLIKAFQAGNYQEALELFQKVVYPLSRAMFYETNPIPVKAAARLIGLPAGNLRLPLVDMEENNLRKLKEDLKRFGLLKE